MTHPTLALAIVALASAAPAHSATDAPQAPASAAAPAAAASAPAVPLERSPRLMPLPRADASRRGPIVLQARSITNQPELQTVAEGDVEFRGGGLVIRADRVAYDNVRDLASAKGGVSVARATNASYTSCPRVDPAAAGDEPDWVLKTARIQIDLDTNEGIADGAQLRFLGVPILGLPRLSFPLNDERKSGWLPPSINIDNRSGLIVSVPWYWNIAPNRDATIAPRVITRRGLGVDSEFRYLEPGFEGALRLDALPNDQVARRSRGSLQWLHEATPATGWRIETDIARVSDEAWWKDFPDAGRSFTPRLLAGRAAVERSFTLPAALLLGDGEGEGSVYARVLRWQVLQDPESFILAPYERSPQIGMALQARAAGGVELALQTEFNRFTLPAGQAIDLARPTGDRWHAVGSLARPVRGDGWFAVPKLALNAAAYRGTQRLASGLTDARRAIPTFSLDLGLELERSAVFFGRELRQTLEPRLLFASTPYRAQSQLPNYDSAAKDFNVVSLFTDNAFSGVDRVSDAKQLTAGFTTRLVDAASGAEALRLGLVQRVLLRPQRVAPQADGSPDGPTLEQRFSDALLVGSTSVLPGWTLDAAVQYSPDIQRSVRSIMGARYSPGPFRTVGATYRLARGLSEQLEVGWQWPVWGAVPGSGRPAGSGGCKGAWYSVGRFNYSLKDSRLTDSILGFEYDAGCWIARVVAEQLSTGRSQATTRILVQLELVGLSRLGSNPLQVLRDNIPGYRLLREDRASSRTDEVGPTP